MEEMVFFHKESATLILTDLIENIEVNDLPFFYKIVFKIGDNQYPKARISRDLRSSFISKKKAIESYTIIESWNPDNNIFAHGRIILEDSSKKLKKSILLVEKIIRMIFFIQFKKIDILDAIWTVNNENSCDI
ncbi:hypothetical protein ACTQ4G_02535 [Streptococcus alactolyticus]|uniref:hypothetical protein n=1 Tax=Streptococcus alactolyticus TaxID=29389 RepID=UPI003F98D177